MKLYIDPDYDGHRGFAPLDEETDFTVTVRKVGERFNVKIDIWRSDCDSIPSWAYDGHFVCLSRSNGTSICGWDNGTIKKGEIRFLHLPLRPERVRIENRTFEIEYTDQIGLPVSVYA